MQKNRRAFKEFYLLNWSLKTWQIHIGIRYFPSLHLLRISFLFITDLKDRYSTNKADILLFFKEEPYMSYI
jgi:hypothetical protein